MAHDHKNCSCLLNNPTASQNLNELEFERSICGAAVQNDVVKVAKCIANGNINDCDNFKYTALHYAARSGDQQICRMLIEAKIDVNAKTIGNSTALHRASMMGHHNIVQLLLQNSACANVKDNDGQTPLHKSAQKGSLESSKLLLGANAELKFIKDNHGRSPADLLTTNNTELIALLQIQ